MSNSVDLGGRVIPLPDERVYALHDRKYFCLQQPSLDLKSIYTRSIDFLGETTPIDFSQSEFIDQFERLREQVLADSTLSNLLKGVYVPFILPRKDLLNDKPLESLVRAAGRSFENEYPDFQFRFLTEVGIDADLEIRKDSRWEVIEEIWNRRSVIGIYFPTAMSGFAIPDHAKVLSRLSDNVVLSGVPDVASAFIGNPSLLMKTDGKYPNLLALTAFAERGNSHMFHFFEAYGWNLYFNRRSQIGAVSEYYSGGLSIVNLP